MAAVGEEKGGEYGAAAEGGLGDWQLPADAESAEVLMMRQDSTREVLDEKNAQAADRAKSASRFVLFLV